MKKNQNYAVDVAIPFKLELRRGKLKERYLLRYIVQDTKSLFK